MKGKVSVNDVFNLFVEMRHIAKVLGPDKAYGRVRRTVKKVVKREIQSNPAPVKRRA